MTTSARLLLLAVVAALPVDLVAAPAMILEGRITDLRGRAVTGAEVTLEDSAGKTRGRTLSALDGTYRLPPVAAGASGKGYRLSVSHIRYQFLRVRDVFDGSTISAAKPSHLAPGDSAALLASTRVASRSFALSPSIGTPQIPGRGPVDPNLAEYYYQQALLLLGRDKRKEAVELLKVYAQIGANPRQIALALQLVARNESGN